MKKKSGAPSAGQQSLLSFFTKAPTPTPVSNRIPDREVDDVVVKKSIPSSRITSALLVSHLSCIALLLHLSQPSRITSALLVSHLSCIALLLHYLVTYLLILTYLLTRLTHLLTHSLPGRLESYEFAMDDSEEDNQPAAPLLSLGVVVHEDKNKNAVSDPYALFVGTGTVPPSLFSNDAEFLCVCGNNYTLRLINQSHCKPSNAKSYSLLLVMNGNTISHLMVYNVTGL